MDLGSPSQVLGKLERRGKTGASASVARNLVPESESPERCRMRTLNKTEIVSAGVFFVMAYLAIAAEMDVPGSIDYKLFTRMPDYYINDYEQTDFDSYTFKNSQGEDVVVEGRKWYVEYVLKAGARSPSQLQIIRTTIATPSNRSAE